MTELTTSWDVHKSQGTTMCWPFRVLPYDGETTVDGAEYLAVTFDGTMFKLYENDTRSNEAHKMYYRPEYGVTYGPNEENPEVLYISVNHARLCHFPISPTPAQRLNGYYTWKNNRLMQFVSLGDGGIFIHWVSERSIEFWRDLR